MFIRSIKTHLQRQYAFVQTITLSQIFSRLHAFKNFFRSLRALSLFAKSQFNIQSGAKEYQLAAILFGAVLFTGCQKEVLSDPALNSTASANADEARLKLPTRTHKDDPVAFYGAYIGVPDTAVSDKDFQLSIADQLGISCLRERVLVPTKSFTFDLVPELTTSYKVLLNFNGAGSSVNSLIPFVTNLAQYKLDLNTILNTFTVLPEVAVIENEESNRFYYSGPANDYIDQLSAAIGVMHARSIKVTNGGITSSGLSYLVYQDLLSQGKEDSAQMFKDLTDLTPSSRAVQDRGAFVDTLLSAYKNMNLDYVNFHWKATSANTQALNQVINYLKKRTGKKIINNELGQFDKDPNTLQTHIQLCTDQKLPYILWYSPDEHDGKKGSPLQHSNRILTASGNAYKSYLKK